MLPSSSMCDDHRRRPGGADPFPAALHGAAIIVTRVSDNGDIAHDVRHSCWQARRCSTPLPGLCLCWRGAGNAASAVFAVQRPAWLYRWRMSKRPQAAEAEEKSLET